MNIDMLIDGLLDSYDRFGGINRSEAENFPNRENVIAVLDDLHCLIFPGFKVAEDILPTNIRYITGQRVNNIIALLTKEYHIAVFTACLAGGCLGFLPHNFNPAKIFMGDSGSTFLGFALACISIEGMFKGYAAISFAVPLLVLALPIFDTTVAILRRVKDHRPIMAPDRGHFHHKLIDMGFSQKQAVGIMYAISALLGISAVILTGFGMERALLLLIIAIVFVIATLLFKNTHHNDEEDK